MKRSLRASHFVSPKANEFSRDLFPLLRYQVDQTRCEDDSLLCPDSNANGLLLPNSLNVKKDRDDDKLCSNELRLTTTLSQGP